MIRTSFALVAAVSFVASGYVDQADAASEQVRAAIEDLDARPADFVRQRRGAERLAKLGAAAEPAIPALIRVLDQPIQHVGGDVMDPVPGFEEAIEAARRALLQIGSAAVPALIEALRHSPPKGGHHVVALLAELNDPRAVAPLVEAIGGARGWVVQKTLIESKLPGVGDAVASRLNDPDPAVRRGVVLTLVGRRDLRALPAIIEVLAKGEQYQRWESVGDLANLRPPDVRERLQVILKDPDLMVRSEAASRLGDVGDSRDVPALIDLLQDSYHRVRWGAARALGLLQDPRALAPLQAALKVESDEGNRQTMQEAIRKIRKRNSP